MLTSEEHARFSQLLWEIRQANPGSSYMKIMWAAKKLVAPGKEYHPDDRAMLNWLEIYAKKVKV